MLKQNKDVKDWLNNEFTRVKCPKCNKESEVLESYKNRFLKDGCHECRGAY